MNNIEYFYSTHSAFAYIGSRMFIELARRHNCSIIHRPVDLRAVVDQVSGQPFGYRSDAHRAYFFDREIKRWSEFRRAPIINHRPTWHDEPLELANGFVISAIQQGHNVDELVHAILEAHWLEDANFNDPNVLSGISRSVGIDPDSVLSLALSDEIQAIHIVNTEEAIKRDVFGSPTYFVKGDMFYGQDHLELVERALKNSFAGT